MQKTFLIEDLFSDESLKDIPIFGSDEEIENFLLADENFEEEWLKEFNEKELIELQLDREYEEEYMKQLEEDQSLDDCWFK